MQTYPVIRDFCREAFVSVIPAYQADIAALRQQALAMQDKLIAIDAGEAYLIGDWEEEYHSWYDDDDGRYSVRDPDHLLDTIDEACRLVHRCVDAELYKEGCDISQILLTLEVNVDGDYVVYQALPMKECSEALFQIFKNTGGRELTLENLIQTGDEELPASLPCPP
ncbi:MAG: hypothetical protein HFI39_06035 [Lachnospiraceae bacterium]|nr:hypothetical protein [Lachnospiraceae bacterium]